MEVRSIKAFGFDPFKQEVPYLMATVTEKGRHSLFVINCKSGRFAEVC